jgi:hypothetical protein
MDVCRRSSNGGEKEGFEKLREVRFCNRPVKVMKTRIFSVVEHATRFEGEGQVICGISA